MAESLVEMFGQPFPVIQQRFRMSELVLLGWRSRERAVAMDRKFKRPSSEAALSAAGDSPAANPVVQSAEALGFMNEQGEPDVRKMSTGQLLALFGTQGKPIIAFPNRPTVEKS